MSLRAYGSGAANAEDELKERRWGGVEGREDIGGE